MAAPADHPGAPHPQARNAPRTIRAAQSCSLPQPALLTDSILPEKRVGVNAVAVATVNAVAVATVNAAVVAMVSAVVTAVVAVW